MVKAQTLHRLLLVAILVGLAFSTYSAIESNITSLQSSCSFSRLVQCGAVDSSHYSHFQIGGLTVPLYAVGIGGFLLLLILDIPLLRTYEARYLDAVTIVAAIGVVVAVLFGSIEVFLIHAICPICLGAYISGVFVLVFAVWLVRLRREADAEASGPAQSSVTS